jgi:hypothetical protein
MPLSPLTPITPFSPVSPVSDVDPVDPVDPVAPVGPVDPIVIILRYGLPVIGSVAAPKETLPRYTVLEPAYSARKRLVNDPILYTLSLSGIKLPLTIPSIPFRIVKPIVGKTRRLTSVVH